MSAGLFLRNEAGRRGVPTKQSFQTWIDAIPCLPRNAQVNILVVGEPEGRRFNRQYRQKDYATNVLSFPWEPRPAPTKSREMRHWAGRPSIATGRSMLGLGFWGSRGNGRAVRPRRPWATQPRPPRPSGRACPAQKSSTGAALSESHSEHRAQRQPTSRLWSVSNSSTRQQSEFLRSNEVVRAARTQIASLTCLSNAT